MIWNLFGTCTLFHNFVLLILASIEITEQRANIHIKNIATCRSTVWTSTRWRLLHPPWTRAPERHQPSISSLRRRKRIKNQSFKKLLLISKVHVGAVKICQYFLRIQIRGSYIWITDPDSTYRYFCVHWNTFLNKRKKVRVPTLSNILHIWNDECLPFKYGEGNPVVWEFFELINSRGPNPDPDPELQIRIREAKEDPPCWEAVSCRESCPRLPQSGSWPLGRWNVKDIRHKFLFRMRSSLVRMRSRLVDRAFDCQCTSCNIPGFDPSILRHSGIWGAADEAVLNIVRKKI
jgi:hypothetical protein